MLNLLIFKYYCLSLQGCYIPSFILDKAQKMAIG